MKEMIKHEESGLLVPPADSATLATALVRLLKNPSLRQHLANAARQRSQDFSIERNVRALEALYAEMLAHKNGRA
jgi:glycosyltransferase involved in cell wall biosynthesis